MTVWFALALMTAAAAFAVLWPLARRRAGLASGSDAAVYRDQLEEIDRDRASGLIEDEEAAAARIEVSRRLIAAADADDSHSAAGPASTRRRRMVAIVAVVLLPLGAMALYGVLGSPLLPDQPLSARLAAARDPSALDRLVAQVEAHLERNPDDGRGWDVIAPVYLRLGRFEDAVKARRHALRLNGRTAEREVGLGEALVFAADGVVTAEAKAAFESAVALDAGNVQARYFLGLAAEQDGNRLEAASIWRALIAAAAPEAAWVDYVRRALTRVEGAAFGEPSDEQIAAAAELSVDQRSAIVRGMVERLSERLHRDGSDLQGWLRLVRSYMVLGEPDKARAAARDARRAFGGDGVKLQRLDDLVKALGLEG